MKAVSPTFHKSLTKFDVLETIRTRLCLSKYYSDSQILEISLALSCNASTELVMFLFDKHTAREVNSLSSTKGITSREWSVLFTQVCGKSVASTVLSELPSFASKASEIQRNLKCTLQEPEQRRLWANPNVRVLCFVALNSRENPEEKMEHLLGSIIRTDKRKLEDLSAFYEANVTGDMLLARAIMSIALDVSTQ